MNVFGNAHHILQGKRGPVLTTTPDALVFDAVKIMGEHNVGALVVVEGGRVVGVLSERDYSRKIVLQGRSSRDTRVREVLSQPVITVTPDNSVNECMRLMTENRIRHLPVVENGKLVGIVSIGDLVNWTIRVQSDTINHLEGYITGQYPA